MWQWRDFWELASYVVTALGLPFAIVAFLYERHKDRDNDEEEAYQILSDAYNEFLTVVLANPDLQLRSARNIALRSPEQHERVLIIFEMLIALFERAYLVAYKTKMSAVERRRWNSWDDYMREWCRRDDFNDMLPLLLRGEDESFAQYIRDIAEEERTRLV